MFVAWRGASGAHRPSEAGATIHAGADERARRTKNDDDGLLTLTASLVAEEMLLLYGRVARSVEDKYKRTT